MCIFKKIESFIVAFEKITMIAIGLLLPGMITVGAIFRYVFKSDLYAIEEIEVFLAVWLYFMGTVYASYKKSHITADILQTMIKTHAIRKGLAVLSSVLTAGICLAFSYWCTDMMTYTWNKSPHTAVWKIPLITQYIAVYVCFILTFLYSVRDFLHACNLTPELQEQKNELTGA